MFWILNFYVFQFLCSNRDYFQSLSFHCRSQWIHTAGGTGPSASASRALFAARSSRATRRLETFTTTASSASTATTRLQVCCRWFYHCIVKVCIFSFFVFFYRQLFFLKPSNVWFCRCIESWWWIFIYVIFYLFFLYFYCFRPYFYLFHILYLKYYFFHINYLYIYCNLWIFYLN